MLNEKIKIKFIEPFYLQGIGTIKAGYVTKAYKQTDGSVVINVGCCGAVNLKTIPPNVFEII